MYQTVLLVIFLVVAVAIIGLVLLQNGKGADMGASFGAGASATLFGSSGTGNFLTRATSVLGLLFFIISITLANLNSRTHSDFSHIEKAVEIKQSTPSEKHKPVINKVRENNPTVDIPE